LRQVSLVLRYTKTVKLDIVLGENCEVKDITISGDFFAYPEDSIERLENRVKKCSSRECVENAFSELVGVVMLGVDVEDLKSKLIRIIENCGEEPGK
jgi:lipoate-protein ligase A